MRNDFALLILSHGRAEKVITLKTMVDCGYTGRWYIIIDNEDSQADKYYELYGKDHIIMFDKYKKSLEIDTCDIARKRNAVIYARESCFEIAKSLGLKYFLELDDDYSEFRSRYEKNGILSSCFVKDMDSIIDEYINFLENTNSHCVAFAQTGDFIGGMGSNLYKKKILRKAMNAFFCSVERPFSFIGRMNDDVNTYVLEGSRGKLFFTPYDMTLNQVETQKNSGGLTDLYMEYGTYVKSFFSVITNPSSVKVYEMGAIHRRIHHVIDWKVAVPCIIREEFKKK
jgi:hypothetical protein